MHAGSTALKSEWKHTYNLATAAVLQPSYCFWTQKRVTVYPCLDHLPQPATVLGDVKNCQAKAQDNLSTDTKASQQSFKLFPTQGANQGSHQYLSFFASFSYKLKLANLKYSESSKAYWTPCKNLLMGRNEVPERVYDIQFILEIADTTTKRFTNTETSLHSSCNLQVQ